MTGPSIWCQTGTGRVVDLIHPTADMINLEIDVAEGLARIARFAGQVRSGPYSVGQHSIMGAEALFRETGSANLALAFLLHDAHEAYMSDITSPAAAAIIHLAGLGWSPGSERSTLCRATTEYAIAQLKNRLDFAIWTAAGNTWPPTPAMAEAIHAMDLRMLATERRHLLGKSPRPWHPTVENAAPIRITGKFTVWPWPDTADRFNTLLKRWRPDARLRAPAPRPNSPPPLALTARKRATA